MFTISSYDSEGTREPHEAIPNLYISSATPTRDKKMLQDIGITHILTAAKSITPKFIGDYHYMLVSIDDWVGEDILYYFNDAIKFIDNARNSGGKVLVHCMAGISRSASIVIAYIMHTQKVPYKIAFEVLRKARPHVQPNPSFKRQLEVYERWILGVKYPPIHYHKQTAAKQKQQHQKQQQQQQQQLQQQQQQQPAAVDDVQPTAAEHPLQSSPPTHTQQQAATTQPTTVQQQPPQPQAATTQPTTVQQPPPQPQPQADADAVVAVAVAAAAVVTDVEGSEEWHNSMCHLLYNLECLTRAEKGVYGFRSAGSGEDPMGMLTHKTYEQYSKKPDRNMPIYHPKTHPTLVKHLEVDNSESSTNNDTNNNNNNNNNNKQSGGESVTIISAAEMARLALGTLPPPPPPEGGFSFDDDLFGKEEEEEGEENPTTTPTKPTVEHDVLVWACKHCGRYLFTPLNVLHLASTHVEVELMEWMVELAKVASVLICPKCRINVGEYDWHHAVLESSGNSHGGGYGDGYLPIFKIFRNEIIRIELKIKL